MITLLQDYCQCLNSMTVVSVPQYYLASTWCGLTKVDKKAPESFKEETELTVSLLNVTYDGKLMQKIYLQLNYLNAVPLPLCSQCFKNYN